MYKQLKYETIMNIKIYLQPKTLLGMVAGALVGFGYYYFIGCKSGTCPITSSPYISTIYGAVVGMLFVFPSKKKKSNENETNN